jgi:hypothetical protein
MLSSRRCIKVAATIAGFIGESTNDLVYQRLAPGILEEFQARNLKDRA